MAEVAPPKNRALGAGLLLAGLISLFTLHATHDQVPHGALWGLGATLLAVAGLFEWLGMLRVGQAELPRLLPRWIDAQDGEAPYLAPRVTVPAAVLTLCILGPLLGLAQLHWVLLAALVQLALSGLRRPGLFVFASASMVTLPMLGQFGLWDPWETHYGEVAREILARNDWITLWWAQDHFFRSKPIYIFWVEALSMSATGMRFWADANPPHPEWAMRLPIYLLSVGTLAAVYAALKRLVSVRAAALGALALATTPYFFFLSHQAITDMPFVANMTIAVCLLMLALHTDAEARVGNYRVGPFRVSAQHLVLGAVVLVALPQVVYLVSRNITFVPWQGFTLPHGDSFDYGSAGNAGLPGNPAHTVRRPYLRAPWFQPAAQGALWLAGLLGIVALLRKERRTQALLMYGFYLFCSFAWMAKGIPGFGLPGLIAALYLLTTGRMPLLLTGRLRIGAGSLVLAVTGLPWFVAMYARLGPMFTDRLLIHDHINRLSSGVHGDKGSFQYFVWQLGYGAFPWIALAPVALTAFLHMRPKPQPGQRDPAYDTLVLLALWFAAAFSLFTAMTTKFHHYIFPAVPPLAMLVGVAADRLMGDDRADADRTPFRAWFGLAAGVLACVLGVAGLWGDVRGVMPSGLDENAARDWVLAHPWPIWLSGLCLLGGGALLAAVHRHFRDDGGAPRSHALLGAGLAAGALTLAFAARDLSWVTSDRPAGYERLIHLFVYNYGRPWPEQFDYRPILTGFAVVLTAAVGFAVLRRVRRLAVLATFIGAFWFSAWCLNVYMIDLTPHWGQRGLVKRYYAERKDSDEPLLAWQMNWKGENFYAGNRVHVFVKLDNKAIKRWMEKHEGTTAYVLLEHTRLKNFRRLMGKRKVEELTSKWDNNKFLLVRTVI